MVSLTTLLESQDYTASNRRMADKSGGLTVSQSVSQNGQRVSMSESQESHSQQRGSDQ
jgi:hypothetical protein